MKTDGKEMNNENERTTKTRRIREMERKPKGNVEKTTQCGKNESTSTVAKV